MDQQRRGPRHDEKPLDLRSMDKPNAVPKTHAAAGHPQPQTHASTPPDRAALKHAKKAAGLLENGLFALDDIWDILKALLGVILVFAVIAFAVDHVAASHPTASNWALTALDGVIGLATLAVGVLKLNPYIAAAGVAGLGASFYTGISQPPTGEALALPLVAGIASLAAIKYQAPGLQSSVARQLKKGIHPGAAAEAVKVAYLAKLAGPAATTLKVYLAVSVAATVVVAAGVYELAPHRSVQAFCQSYQTQTQALTAKYSSQLKSAASQSSPLVGLLEATGSLLQAQGDAIVFMDKLDRVAPDDIEPDVAAVRDTYKSQADATQHIASDPLGSLAQGIISGIQGMGASQRVDDYIKNNCNLSFMNQTASADSAAAPSAPQTPQLNLDNAAAFQPWKNSQSGILADDGNTLILLDPSSFKVIAKLALPQTQGRTPGGDAGKSYRLSTDQSPNFLDFDATYSKIPLQFSTSTAADGTQTGNNDLGYYDLATGQAVDLGVQPDQYFGDPVNRNLLLYQDSNNNDTWMTFNFTNGQKAAYTGSIDPSDLQTYANLSSSCCSAPNYVWNASHTSLVSFDSHPDVTVQPTGASSSDMGCNVIQMLDATNALCVNATGGNDLEAGSNTLAKLNVSSIINNVTQTDDPSSYDYQPGHLHYTLPAATTLASQGTVPNPEAGNIIVSPDDKTVLYISAGTIYKANLTDGDTAQIATVPDNTGFEFLQWR